MAVCLITGCSRGIGLATALHFAQAGETVVAGVRRLPGSEELARRGGELGVDIEVVVMDVDHEASVTDAVAGVVGHHGGVDVLVNNAGVGLRGAVEATTDADVRHVFETNVFGPLRVMRAVLPIMRDQRRGVVVNVSSLSGRVANPFAGVYSATKFALEAVSEALHYEVSPFGVRVVVVEPGRTSTGFAAHRLEASGDGAPYAARIERWEQALAGLPGRETSADPAMVAAAIYEAARCADHPLRRLVGADAELVGALRHDLGDAEFERTLRSALDFWD